jgi:molecular chaperone GrpE (heat shock protein)
MADDYHDADHVSTESDGSAGESLTNDTPADIAARIDLGVNRILEAFEDKLKYDASKQQSVDRLYSELQGYRSGLVAQAVRPFIFGMIRHHAEIGKLLTAIQETSAEEMSPAKFCQLLESLQEDVEEVLGENGVAAYRAEVSDPFDPVRQTVVGRAMPTTEEDRSGTVAACLGPGFEHEGRILVKARVSAYRFQPPSLDS